MQQSIVTATSLFDEKKASLYQRLLAAPVRRTHIVWSKCIFGILLGLVQLLHAGKLKGKIAPITGGNSGIGLATAREFVNKDAYVFITGRREVEFVAT